MKSNLNVPEKDGKDDTKNVRSEQQPETPIPNADANKSGPADNSTTSNVEHTDEPWVVPKAIEKHLRWKRRRETWVPLVNLAVGLFALFVILAQALIYNQQRQIMNRQREVMDTQTQLMERSLRVSERAYVGVANLTANMEAGEVLIMLENIGNVPARAVNMEANVYRVTPASDDVRSEPGRERVKETITGSTVHWDAGKVHLFPGNLRARVAIPMQNLKPEDVNAILSKKQILYVGGTIHYEDGFGNPDSTTFAFEYNPPPNEGWTVHSGLSKVFGKEN